mmetsp:Transcript_69071/g.158549  ORF Transcript_69071/g.158549 Transcript_69071/m.158549 type:complete len:306 (-) Transcript_69071:913-1830(-)
MLACPLLRQWGATNNTLLGPALPSGSSSGGALGFASSNTAPQSGGWTCNGGPLDRKSCSPETCPTFRRLREACSHSPGKRGRTTSEAGHPAIRGHHFIRMAQFSNNSSHNVAACVDDARGNVNHLLLSANLAGSSPSQQFSIAIRSASGCNIARPLATRADDLELNLHRHHSSNPDQFNIRQSHLNPRPFHCFHGLPLRRQSWSPHRPQRCSSSGPELLHALVDWSTNSLSYAAPPLMHVTPGGVPPHSVLQRILLYLRPLLVLLLLLFVLLGLRRFAGLFQGHTAVKIHFCSHAPGQHLTVGFF